MHHGMPAGWSAGEWNARMWATADMEESITHMFVALGLGARLTAMKDVSLNVYPGQQQTNAFWLPVWKFRLDREAKNGCPALSQRLSETLPNTCLVCG